MELLNTAVTLCHLIAIISIEDKQTKQRLKLCVTMKTGFPFDRLSANVSFSTALIRANKSTRRYVGRKIVVARNISRLIIKF